MTQADSIALLISLQERVNKVFDDIKADRELDREQLQLLVDRVEKLEQAGTAIKKHDSTVVALAQNPTVLFAIITVVALFLVGNVDFNVVISKFIEYLAK